MIPPEKRQEAFPPRKQHWINQCNSSGCEVVLFDHRYTIWLSNKDWKEAERDGELLIKALESVEYHTEILSQKEREARASAFEEAAARARIQAYEEILGSIQPYDNRESIVTGMTIAIDLAKKARAPLAGDSPSAERGEGE